MDFLCVAFNFSGMMKITDFKMEANPVQVL
jgi:hypothetical protein